MWVSLQLVLGCTHKGWCAVLSEKQTYFLEMEQNCTLLINPQGALATAAELQADLESPEVPRKIAGLKKAIFLLLSGEDMPRALMTVIRFCITVEDHTLQVWGGGVPRRRAAGGRRCYS